MTTPGLLNIDFFYSYKDNNLLKNQLERSKHFRAPAFQRKFMKIGIYLVSHFSKHRPSGLMLSKSNVCLSVRLFTFEVPFKCFFAPISRQRFPIDQRPLVEGLIANFGIFLDVFEVFVLDDLFRFSNNLGFGVFLVHPEATLPD